MAEGTSYIVHGPKSPVGLSPLVMVAAVPATHRSAADAVAAFVEVAAQSPAHTLRPAADVDLPSGAKGREIQYDSRTPAGVIHCRMRMVLLGTTMHAALLMCDPADQPICLEGQRTLLRWDPPAVLTWVGAP